MSKRERRTYTRLKVHHLVKFRVISDSPEKQPLQLASIKDIGGGGACLRLSEPLPLSTQIQLYINFPQVSQPVPCLAKVVWVKKIREKTNLYEAGLQFLEIEHVLRDEIVKRVEWVDKKMNEEEEEI